MAAPQNKMARFAWLPMLLVVSCRNGSDEEARRSEVPPQPAEEPTKKRIGPAPVAQSPVRLPGVMEPAPWLGEATRVVAYGAREQAVIVAAGTGWLRWYSPDGKQLGERLGDGGAQVLEVVDLDGDGEVEILWGRGRARGATEALASLELLRLGSKVSVETLPLPKTSRAQVVAAHPVPGTKNEIWVASFVSKFEVEVNRFARSESGEWSLAESRGRHRVVGDMTVLPDGAPVIARMYGDDADAAGGVYVLPSADVQSQIPSTRGARAVLATDSGVAMADGWHKEYGKKAQGLVSIAGKEGESWAIRARVQAKNSYGFSRLRLGDVHKVQGSELVASGNGNAIVMLPSRPDLLFELSDRVAADAYPIDLSGDSRMEVVIVGPVPAIWNAR